MLRRSLIVLSVLLLALGTTPAVAAPLAGYTGIVRLSNCSGSLIRLPTSKDTDPALVLTNGHCEESGMPAPGEVIVDRPVRRPMTLLGQDGSVLGTLHSTKIAYATMTDTDVTLYQLDRTYRQIARTLGGHPLTLAAAPADVHTPISVVSGFFKRTWTCSIDRVVYSLHEAGWVWKIAIRYTPECDVIHGTSGSPIIDRTSGEVVGVNNTGNDDGEACSLNNPCEVDENGVVTVLRGRSYGEQTYLLTACAAPGNEIDLNLPGCMLPKPPGFVLPLSAR
ncbi:serine protease [Amycolatopsis cynarae]|uniref:Serine protease n=1 Tax=Amycolatopsis cynarae TaxID=2995223 RepID=A0ABY7B4D3_9PSEU|nr:serine protease [Amycolatopsis sp. HUAS 11-8]WAL66088.1 serine protease [Amycolatopsis sp. HUAS 11-8]